MLSALPSRFISKIVPHGCVVLVVLVGLSFAGCKKQSSVSELLGIESQMKTSSRDSNDVVEAFRYVPKMLQRDRRAVVKEIKVQLSAWNNKRSTSSNWTAPQLVSTLPKEIPLERVKELLQRADFDEPDCDFLYQASSMRSTSKWIASNDYRDILFADWLVQQKSVMNETEYLQLEMALKLFDWTIRNVWADGNAKDIESLPPNPKDTSVDIGPGYGQLPWQTMMYSRGDPISRARVFSQLAFQQSIPVVWLGLPTSGSDEIKLWALGVPIGKSIFLFEPRMGIPLPGPNQIGVATLMEAQKDPSVLRRARLTDQFGYAVASTDIGKLVALLDVDPMVMTERMQRLEKDLTGELRMKLTADVDAWSEQIKSAAPGLETRLWNVPWLAYQYSQVLNEKLQVFSPFSMQYMQARGLFIDDTPLTRARGLHFRGTLNNKFDEQGAWEAYMDLQVDDATLARLPFDIEIQKQLSVTRLPNEEQQDFFARIQIYQGLYRRAKLESALFLAMAKFDNGEYSTALDFADKRMLAKVGTDVWHPMCWYLMARANEHLGQFAKADELYKKNPSAQEPGNRIRARLLRSRVEAGNALGNSQDNSNQETTSVK